MGEYPSGPWIAYSDYEALAARVERWKEAAGEATKTRLILAARVEELETDLARSTKHVLLNAVDKKRLELLRTAVEAQKRREEGFQAENQRLREALAEARYAAVAIPLEALSAAGYAGGLSEDLQDALAARVVELEGELRATNDILTDRNNELFTARQENKRLREDLDLATEEWGDEEWEILEERRAALKEKP